MPVIIKIMNIVKTISELDAALALVEGQTVGFVPTMGALHEGHLQLVKQAVAENDYCVVSIFVNPTQFNNASDLAKYPRTLEADLAMLQAVGCHLVFAPEKDAMYAANELEDTFNYNFDGLDKVMEGKFRPGHFNGVVQVVSKLFRLVKPTKAYFGEKDFQQLAIIHHMVKTLGFAVEVIDCPIVRESSGLAMSSRNERLTSEQRSNAAHISKVLFESQSLATTMTPTNLQAWVVTEINKNPFLETEYFDIVDSKTLQTINQWGTAAVGCVAVFCGEVRLIDNVRY